MKYADLSPYAEHTIMVDAAAISADYADCGSHLLRVSLTVSRRELKNLLQSLLDYEIDKAPSEEEYWKRNYGIGENRD